MDDVAGALMRLFQVNAEVSGLLLDPRGIRVLCATGEENAAGANVNEKEEVDRYESAKREGWYTAEVTRPKCLLVAFKEFVPGRVRAIGGIRDAFSFQDTFNSGSPESSIKFEHLALNTGVAPVEIFACKTNDKSMHRLADARSSSERLGGAIRRSFGIMHPFHERLGLDDGERVMDAIAKREPEAEQLLTLLGCRQDFAFEPAEEHLVFRLQIVDLSFEMPVDVTGVSEQHGMEPFVQDGYNLLSISHLRPGAFFWHTG